MVEKNGVNDSDSQTDTDERGVPLKNLQAEFDRKLEKMNEQNNANYAALAQKIDGLTRDDGPIPADVSPDKREELVRISADPHGYVAKFVKPLEEKAAAMERELQEQRKATSTAQWERMEDRIARAEGKKDWKELPEDMQKGIRQEIITRGWNTNPASAMDAYEIYKARQLNTQNSDPDRINRIRNNQSEGGGRSSVTRGSAQTVSRETLSEISRTAPSHPDYKKNMETLDRVQKGLVKVEG